MDRRRHALHPRSPCYSQGFTLIEMSIVLVVVALLVAGIVGSQTMIYNFNMRKAASSLEQYGTLVNTFRIKYNCLPGDCANGDRYFRDTSINPWTTPQNCGMFNGSSYYGCSGDGDGVIEAVMGSQLTAAVEAFVMWQHLNLAGMWTFVPVTTNPLRCNAAYPCFFSHHDKTSVMIRSSDSFNRFWLFSDYYYDNDGAIATSSYLQMQNGLSSNDAQWLDAKLDDGLAFTGKMIAYGVTAGQTSYTPNNSYPCVSTATGNPYRIYSHIPGRNCLITVQAPF